MNLNPHTPTAAPTGAPTPPSTALTRLADPATRANPYPIYAHLRATGPQRIPNGPTVFATHADCLAILRHPDVSSDRRRATSRGRARATRRRARPQDAAGAPPAFLRLDPPDHTRLRRLVSFAFTPKLIHQLRPNMTALIDDLLDAASARGSLELVGDLAYPLPIAVICRLLGVPLADEPLFHTCSALLARSLDPIGTLDIGDDPYQELAAARQARTQLRAYLGELVARRRRDPGPDLITALIAAHESGHALSEPELISTCVLLLIAGHETTVNLITNTALALLRHPHHWAALVDHPQRASDMVTETLRYDPPVHFLSRIATAELTIGPVTVPAGDVALLAIGGTGRDPAIAVRPDTFDPDRTETRSLAFGMGPHYCLGAPLARLETQLAVHRLAQRARNPHLLTDPPTYKPNLILRGVATLPIGLDDMAPRTVPWGSVP